VELPFGLADNTDPAVEKEVIQGRGAILDQDVGDLSERVRRDADRDAFVHPQPLAQALEAKNQGDDAESDDPSRDAPTTVAPTAGAGAPSTAIWGDRIVATSDRLPRLAAKDQAHDVPSSEM
jgi:hypothetical protein